jgi:hypothetical protein
MNNRKKLTLSAQWKDDKAPNYSELFSSDIWYLPTYQVYKDVSPPHMCIKWQYTMSTLKYISKCWEAQLLKMLGCSLPITARQIYTKKDRVYMRASNTAVISTTEDWSTFSIFYWLRQYSSYTTSLTITMCTTPAAATTATMKTFKTAFLPS